MAQEYPESKEETELPSMTSKHNPLLRVESAVLEYCKQHSNAQSISLKRRFEYKFCFFGLEVVMLHFLCDQNKLHLVEIFHFQNKFMQNVVAPALLSLLTKIFRGPLSGRIAKKVA